MTSFNLTKNVSETFDISVSEYTENSLLEWDSGKTGGYSTDDMVTYGGLYYISVANTNSYVPTNITYWKTLILRTAKIDNSIGIVTDYTKNIEATAAGAHIHIASPELTGVPEIDTEGGGGTVGPFGGLSGNCFMYEGQPSTFSTTSRSFAIGGTYSYSSSVGSLTNLKSWWPFAVYGISQGENIASAKITFASAQTCGEGNMAINFGCELSPSASTPISGDDLNRRSYGSNYVTHYVGNWVLGYQYTYDITEQVQTIINLPTWTSSIAVIVLGNNTGHYHYTNSTSYYRMCWTYSEFASRPVLTITKP